MLYRQSLNGTYNNTARMMREEWPRPRDTLIKAADLRTCSWTIAGSQDLEHAQTARRHYRLRFSVHRRADALVLCRCFSLITILETTEGV